MLEWTGERYLPYINPSICGAEIHYEHLHRYAFASQFVKGKKVLDLASGEGFGASILSKNARCVVGIDIDHEAVLHASNTYKKENIEFREGSILNIPIEGREVFDVIVCFEAIEHVTDHDILFQEITRLLKNNGILIISTPNKKTYSDDVGYTNPYHQKELYLSEFYELLKKNFAFIYVSGQQVLSGSSISPVESGEITSISEFAIELKNNHFSFSGIADHQPRYFIAIASNTSLDPSQIQRSYLIDKSNAEITLLTYQIGQCSTTIHLLEQDLSNNNSRLQEENDKVREFTAKFAELSQHTHNLETIVRNSENRITELSQHTNNLETIVRNSENRITELSQHTNNLEAIVTENNIQRTELTAQIQSLAHENNSIKQSLTYQLTTKFHKKVIVKLFPEGAHRGKYYYLGIKGGRILINEGWNSCWRQIKEKLSHKPIPWGKITVPSIKSKGIQESEDITPIETKVSIIIPTKNAGSDFEGILEKISRQKAIQAIEIIIIDSGSTDKTVEIARKYGAKIIRIDPETFNHGTTRNAGAENATGDYICFLVQDAIPIGYYWLYKMVNVMIGDQQIAAVTCRQIPRSDADLFACFGLWQHYTHTLDAHSDRVSEFGGDFNTLSGEQKRQLAGLDDVSCLIRKKIFEKYQFRKIRSSEDLDLGKRLIQERYKNAFLFSVGVIHSHNRDVGYFLNRSYVDTKTVTEILNYNTQDITPGCTLSEVFGSIITLYNSLDLTLHSVGKSDFSLPIRELCLKIRSNIVNNYRYFENNRDQKISLRENNRHSLGDRILALTKDLEHKPDNSNKNQNTLILDQYLWVINNFLEYNEIFDTIEDKKDEVIDCYYKIFSVIAGASLASYYMHKSVKNDVTRELELINLDLSKGV